MLPEGFKYEIGAVAGEGDMVFVHGRYTGFAPVPLVAVDIFRVVDGKLAEHWDVLQAEEQQTASGRRCSSPADRLGGRRISTIPRGPLTPRPKPPGWKETGARPA